MTIKSMEIDHTDDELRMLESYVGAQALVRPVTAIHLQLDGA